MSQSELIRPCRPLPRLTASQVRPNSSTQQADESAKLRRSRRKGDRKPTRRPTD